MNSSLIRFIIVKNDTEYNVLLDNSFSLNDNFRLLSTIADYDFTDCLVYDEQLNIFLDKEIEIDKYHFPSSRTLYIY